MTETDIRSNSPLPPIGMVSTHGYVAAEPPLGKADTGGQVVGTIPITFSDYGVEAPDLGFVSVEDTGSIEFSLNALQN